MNLELLDPFRRQVPDRVDSTLSLPESLFHIDTDGSINTALNTAATTTTSKKPAPPIAAHHIAFNRRGSYVAVGYANGTIAVYDILSRTVSSVYRMNIVLEAGDENENNEKDNNTTTASKKRKNDDHHGITSLSWSRRSRTLLAGSLASPRVILIDNTHPAGSERCVIDTVDNEPTLDSTKSTKNKQDDDEDDDNERLSPVMGTSSRRDSDASESKFVASSSASFDTTIRTQLDQQFLTTRHVPVRIVDTVKADVSRRRDPQQQRRRRRGLQPLVKSIQSSSATNTTTITRRYPAVTFDLPQPIATLQVHPKDSLSGLAVLQDGSLVVFAVPAAAFEESQEGDESSNENIKVLVSGVFADSEYNLTCACLDPHGEKLYAGTQEGKVLGFEVKDLWDRLGSINRRDENPVLSALEPNFVVPVPGGASVWHMVVSRNGKFIILNSADAALRLYSTFECWTAPEEVEKPLFVFQDVVNKVKFASCDISGDGEYVAGGAQGEDTKYEVYIWNTSTGVLADKLTGAPVDLYSIAWQPTRSFLAVAASDGLVDVWGPRINWTAFAPDFQALPHNVEYVEREDEFDEVVAAEKANGEEKNDENDKEDEEKAHVDILTLHKIPVFQSDSEDEEDVFHFDVVRRPAGGNTTVKKTGMDE